MIAETLEMKNVFIDYENAEYEEWGDEGIMLGDLNPMRNEDVYKSWLSVMRSKEYRENMSRIKKGFVHSEKTKKKMSESAKRVGTGTWNLGKEFTEEHKKNMKSSALKRERFPCAHCGSGYTKANLAKHEKSCSSKK